ncbi:MAG: CPBP family intramembrane metalloprotease [Candidatus Lokiarchaeota archaeon]|nr:CPBP family intramembrane metalloprotease [Candidatus Lokiarchaeota archaeon]
MGELYQNRKKEIALKRFRFFYQEIVWGFILIFVFLLLPLFLIPLIVNDTSPLSGILIYSLRAIFVILGILLIFPLSNLIFESQKRNIIVEEDISPGKGFLKIYKMSNKNYKYQIFYGLLIFFLVFLPIDFFTYLLVPQMLEYQSLALPNTDVYLNLGTPYMLFLISVIIIQFSVAIFEETISRGLLTKRGSEHFFSMSAVMISALYFGFGHFAYFLNPVSRFFPMWYPFIWFLQAFIIGIVLSLFVLRKKWIFPVIIAHTLNNIISAHAVWSFNNAVDFSVVALYLYCPLLIIGCVLFIWQFTQIKESLSIGFKMLSSYFKRDNNNEDTKGDLIFRVFIDILMGLIIFFMGFLVMI